MILHPRKSKRERRQKHDAYPSPWRQRTQWTWSVRRCPYCHEVRWANKRLVKMFVRFLAPDRVQRCVKPIPRDRWPDADHEHAYPCPPTPKRRCQCSNRVNGRWGP